MAEYEEKWPHGKKAGSMSHLGKKDVKTKALEKKKSGKLKVHPVHKNEKKEDMFGDGKGDY